MPMQHFVLLRADSLAIPRRPLAAELTKQCQIKELRKLEKMGFDKEAKIMTLVEDAGMVSSLFECKMASGPALEKTRLTEE